MSKIDELLEIMARLRAPDDGCPWDVEQTFETIAPYTIEEAYEVDHAIALGDMNGLCDELGDLLLQVVFHAQMADEAGLFDFERVVEAICDKLVRRHPHIFGAEKADFRTAEDQTRFWEEAKAAERERKAQASNDAGEHDLFEGIPNALPALARAAKLHKRAERSLGEHWAGKRDVLAEFESAAGRLRDEVDREGTCDGAARDAVGAMLAACVDVARRLGVDPEESLRVANHDYEARARARSRESEA